MSVKMDCSVILYWELIKNLYIWSINQIELREEVLFISIS